MSLSSGNKRKVSIVRALLRDSELTLFDEITNSLDNENEKKIFENIFIGGNKKTFFIVSHRHETLKNCDSILLFDDGKIIEKSSYKEIIKKFDISELDNHKN